jgi:magnesium chelatase subunit I
VLPEVETALLAGHDFVLLGERGQGKTRLMRTLVGLLDEWTPVVAGCEINDHPYAPACVRCRGLAAELGDRLPVSWRRRDERYGEKLATPDTSVGDLVGDVDPTKVAEGRALGDPETVHYGLLPRANRGIFGINELPDLAERIQVALFNVLEERDIQVRGYALRLPLDMFLVASANPEDYTNRGRIITPLKDRFGAEIRTHYPLDVDDEIALIRQEAGTVGAAEVPDHLVEVVARLVDELRDSSAVDQRSGVSARFAVAATEGLAAAALRRSSLVGEDDAVARIGDLPAVLTTLRGKLEFEMGEEGREAEVVAHLTRLATVATYRERMAGVDLSGFTDRFTEGDTVRTGALVSGSELLGQIGSVPGLAQALSALGVGEDNVTPGQVAAAVEFVLESLHLTRRLSKDSVDGTTVYGS